MKEAFELIKEKLEEASFVDYDEHYTDNGECLVTISDAISIVSEVEAEFGKDINVRGNGWIPCSERLPKECVPVLVCNVDGKVYIRQINWVARASVEIPFWSQNSTGIIAWMPLPEPYKPEK